MDSKEFLHFRSGPSEKATSAEEDENVEEQVQCYFDSLYKEKSILEKLKYPIHLVANISLLILRFFAVASILQGRLFAAVIGGALLWVVANLLFKITRFIVVLAVSSLYLPSIVTEVVMASLLIASAVLALTRAAWAYNEAVYGSKWNPNDNSISSLFTYAWNWISFTAKAELVQASAKVWSKLSTPDNEILASPSLWIVPIIEILSISFYFYS